MAYVEFQSAVSGGRVTMGDFLIDLAIGAALFMFLTIGLLAIYIGVVLWFTPTDESRRRGGG